MSGESIVTRTATAFGVDRQTLCGKSRASAAAHARQAAMYALRRHGWTTTAIGALFGRDHHTVVYGARAAEARAITNPTYARQLAELLPDQLGV